MNKIIVELTEEQAEIVFRALQEYNNAIKMPQEWHAFVTRIIRKLNTKYTSNS